MKHHEFSVSEVKGLGAGPGYASPHPPSTSPQLKMCCFFLFISHSRLKLPNPIYGLKVIPLFCACFLRIRNFKMTAMKDRKGCFRNSGEVKCREIVAKS